MNQDYHLIVVGTDVSGLVTAYLCAKDGLKVLILDKGELAGNPNPCGSCLVTKKMLNQIDTEFFEKMQFERILNTKSFISLGNQDSVELKRKHSFQSDSDDIVYIFDKAKFTKKLLELSEQAGAEIQSNVVAKKTLIEDGHVTGVEIHTGFKYSALITLINDDLQSNLLADLNIEHKLDVKKNAIYASELLKSSNSEINDAFRLIDKEGASLTVIGNSNSNSICTLYTFDDSVQINVLVLPVAEGNPVSELDAMQALEDLKSNSEFNDILKSSEILNRSIEVIQNSNDFTPQGLFGNGFLVSGLSANIFTVMNKEDIKPQLISGLCAYKTVKACNDDNRSDKKFSGLYYNLLKEHNVPKLIHHSIKMYKYLQNNPQFLVEYPNAITEYSRDLFSFDPDSTETQNAFEKLTDKAGGFFNLLKDFFGLRNKLK